MMRYDQIEHKDGRWWRDGGEITAPFYATDLDATVFPPWWPWYHDRQTGLLVNLERSQERGRSDCNDC